ncbi:TonB-dependent receptor [Ideonella sp. TBM-1]|uniref:TonB-dependent receptor n=1 Tax=Ideonella livida TaxID=2707176 RepID=A0A7C9TI44_9BURK|nr:TonB-dependent receptor [Ideonella livida]
MPRQACACAWAAAALLAGLCAGPATAQSGTGAQRVVITGSALKTLEGETALPVQTLTREEIGKAGATTASEVLALVSANTKGLTDGVSISTGGYRDQTGLNAANLRGIGVSSTLVLLNGRRLANFASPGDDAGVDLHNIPAAALDRVEVLLDGASALYGTDAVGGVINFITRSDYQGLELNASVSRTREGGAGKRTASLAAGAGELGRDGFNVFGVLDLQRTDALSTSQRRFISDLRIPERLPHLLSSYTSPGNIRLSGSQRDLLQAEGFSTNGVDVIQNRTINLSAPDCQAPHSLYLPQGVGGVDGCTYDYMRDVELAPRSESLSLLTRGTLDLGGGTQLFAEALLARAKTYYVGTSNRVNADLDVSLIPRLAATGLGALAEDDEDRIITVRTRILEAGRRQSELTSTAQRWVLGLSGASGAWDYDAALTHSVNGVKDRDAHGYLLYTPLMDGYASGVLNPFGQMDAAGRAYLDSLQVDDVARRAKGTLDSVDAKASRQLGRLSGGPVQLALGAELRRERAWFKPSELLVSDEIQGDPSPGDGQATDQRRRVAAAFGELALPLAPAWLLQLAVRHDHYQQVGGTTNPKAGLRFQPAPEWLLRASAGTGFRAPSLSDLYRPARAGQTSVLPDPVYCADNDNDYSVCADNWDTAHFSNPRLKPERSRQFSLGLVMDPSRHWFVSLDWWAIHKRDLISEIGEDVILANPAKYAGLIHRYNEDEGLCDYDPDDSSICLIELHKANRGKEVVRGLDLVVQLRGARTAWGEWGAKLAGTQVLSAKRQTAPGDPYVSNLGRFVTDGVVQRWRHRLSVDWGHGAWAASLGNTYSAGYTDQNSAIDTDSGSVVAANRVKAYSLWDASASWQATPQLRLRLGVQNLRDTAPPYSNQAYHFINGYDPSYTDPRGRTTTLGLQLALR